MIAAALLLALALDLAIGWPDPLFRRIGHPVSWMGAMIARLEAAWNRPRLPPETRRRLGMKAALLTIAAATLPALGVTLLLPDGLLGIALTALLAAPFLAAKSLGTHVRAVADPLAAGDDEAARSAVSRIVGRDPQSLTPPGIARASIESLAENSSDGVIAPLFWGLLLGLPGLAAYKAINTLDSMIGYTSERYRDFGRFAARLDDVANYIPARITGLLIALVGQNPSRAMAVMRRDAPSHRSPNAGWPEAAMAASLGCRLSGPRAYGAGIEPQPWLNGDAPDPAQETTQAALRTYHRCLGLTALLLALLAWATY